MGPRARPHGGGSRCSAPVPAPSSSSPRSRRRPRSVTVFQRSAPYVIPKPDRAYRAAAKRGLDRVPGLLRSTACAPSSPTSPQPRLQHRAAADEGHRARFRRHLTRRCPTRCCGRSSRPPTRGLQADPAVQRLVPGAAAAPRRAGHRSVAEIAAGRRRDRRRRPHEVDTLVLGTGFAATELLAPMKVVGRGGRGLHAAVEPRREAYLGTAVAGFPNLFLLYGPNTNLGHNSIVLMLEARSRRPGSPSAARGRDGGRGRRTRSGVQRAAAAAARRDGLRRRLPQLVPHATGATPRTGRHDDRLPPAHPPLRLEEFELAPGRASRGHPFDEIWILTSNVCTQVRGRPGRSDPG